MSDKDMQFWAYLFDDHAIRGLGWFDMTDWHKGFNEVLAYANDLADDYQTGIAFPLKGEYLEDYIEDLQVAIKQRDEGYEDH